MSTSLSVRGAACERFGSGGLRLGAALVGASWRQGAGDQEASAVGARSIARTITIVLIGPEGERDPSPRCRCSPGGPDGSGRWLADPLLSLPHCA